MPPTPRPSLTHSPPTSLLISSHGCANQPAASPLSMACSSSHLSPAQPPHPLYSPAAPPPSSPLNRPPLLLLLLALPHDSLLSPSLDDFHTTHMAISSLLFSLSHRSSSAMNVAPPSLRAPWRAPAAPRPGRRLLRPRLLLRPPPDAASAAPAVRRPDEHTAGLPPPPRPSRSCSRRRHPWSPPPDGLPRRPGSGCTTTPPGCCSLDRRRADARPPSPASCASRSPPAPPEPPLDGPCL